MEVLVNQQWVAVPEPPPMSSDDEPRRAGTKVAFEEQPIVVDDVIYKNWTTPEMRRDQQAWIDLDRSVNEREAPTPSVANTIGRQREMARLLASPHLQDKQIDLQQLLSAESEEEINAMYTGQELERQRSAIPCGPLYVSAAFGEARITDIAAIDSGATQSFVSKSWLYDYLRKGGNMRVLTFDAVGHETFDGTCFYTFGTVEIEVHLEFGEGCARTLKLVANVAKDSTAMYSVLMGTTFLGMNRVFVVDHLKGIFLAEDLPDDFRAQGHRVEVNWKTSALDVYAAEDYYLQPGTRLLTKAELQEIQPRKRKKRKECLVNACVVDMDKTYAFVPKPTAAYSTVANAMTIVQPTPRDAGDGVTSDSESVASYETGKAAEEYIDQDLMEDDEIMPMMPDDSAASAEGAQRSSKERKESENLRQVVDTAAASIVKGACNIPIQLANCGEEPVVIRKGTYLGQVHEAIQKPTTVEIDLGQKAQHQPEDLPDGYSEEDVTKLIDTLKIRELDIGEEHIGNLIKLIRKYASVFARTSEEVGQVRLMKVGIDVQGHPPIRVKPYRVSPTERGIIKVEVEKMLSSGVIEPSTSAWASPVVLVPKPDGSVRFAIDFRKLNEVTRKETYPMPNIQDYLDVLRGNEYFTIADGQQAYFGLPMDENSQPLTAFICHLGQYEFLKMPFGLCNAPAIYQRLMSSMLQGMLWEECLVYLDDICLMSATVEQHLERLERLFQRLTAAGILLKPSKCHLLQRSIKLLGHVIDRDGTRPIGAKVKAIHNFKISSRADLHTFLGMTGYYSQYCKDYAEVSIPLRKLLHGKGPFSMDTEHEIAIIQLKNVLVSEPVLAHPDWDLPFQIHCDASNYAIGVVLCQIIDGKERVIGYYSRLLRDAEKKYNTTQKECLAVVWAVKKLRPYLYGRPFIVKTDHASLKWLLNLKDHNGRLMRWALLLQDYTYVIMHRAGKAHANADALSRLIQLGCLESQQTVGQSSAAPQDKPEQHFMSSIANAVLRSQDDPYGVKQRQRAKEAEELQRKKEEEEKEKEQRQGAQEMLKEGEAFQLKKKTGVLLLGDETEADQVYDQMARWIKQEQQKDPVLKSILKHFTRETRQDYVTDAGTVYRLKNHLLHLAKTHTTIRGVKEQREFLLVPKTLQMEVIRLHHDHPTAGHFGVLKTLKRLQQSYAWDGMATMVEKYVRSCIPCQRNNQKELSNAVPKPVIPSGPFDIVSLDCIRLPDSIHGNTYVLVAIDYFTKYSNTYVLDGKPSTANTMRALVKYLEQHALVRTFRCDQGSEFTNSCFKEACFQLGIELQPIPTEHHRANGLVERFNRTLQNALCKVMDESVQMNLWEEYVSWVTLAYNTSFHASIQDTPFFLVYGRHAILPGDLWMFSRAHIDQDRDATNLSIYKRDMVARFAYTYARAQGYLQKYYDRMLLKAEQKNKVTFDVGDEVWVYQPEVQQKEGVRRKLSYQWHGPLVIADKHPDSDVLYRVYLENRARRTEGFIHVNRSKKYVTREARPDDVVLPVPTYDLEYEDLPVSSTLHEEPVDEIDGDHDDPAFDLIQHPKRAPTAAEAALVGKVFFVKGTRCQVFRISYHQALKVMVAHYRYQHKKGNKWINVGTSDCSSIPEVVHWISRDAAAVYGADA